jgi:DNA-binding response OmpR family regulator
MNHKVLLADDSLTIQKVIKITLANQPYDITDCSSESELFSSLKVVNPEIVFLDFNLSETKNGYDLCSKIKEILPQTKILLLLGTFDTIDEALFKKCGASDKIVKPFDSNKFISICKELIAQASKNKSKTEEVNLPKDEDLEFPEIIDTKSESDLDHWEMNTSSETKVSHEQSIQIAEDKVEFNPLEQEISDWGMSVPGVINKLDNSDIPELPPIISTEKHEIKSSTPAEIKFPESSDLDFPDLQASNTSPSLTKSSPQLISIDEFKDLPLELEVQGNYVEDLADIKSIEAQIKDEVESDLWVADEFEAIKQEVTSKIEEMKISFPDSTAANISIIPPTEKLKTQADVNMNRSDVEELVKKYVKEYLDQMFKQNVEKISWEIIPDLAENLIKQELAKISNKVIND